MQKRDRRGEILRPAKQQIGEIASKEWQRAEPKQRAWAGVRQALLSLQGVPPAIDCGIGARGFFDRVSLAFLASRDAGLASRFLTIVSNRHDAINYAALVVATVAAIEASRQPEKAG